MTEAPKDFSSCFVLSDRVMRHRYIVLVVFLDHSSNSRQHIFCLLAARCRYGLSKIRWVILGSFEIDAEWLWKDLRFGMRNVP